MVGDYISREAATAELCERCADAVMCTRSDDDCPIKKGLNAIPAADVVERKNGRWIEDGYYNKPCVCSYCGEPCKDTVMGKPRWIYCPLCGSKNQEGSP